MKKILFILIPLVLCGCSRDMNRKEIDEVNFIHALGIDYSNNEYTLSALYSSSGGADQDSGSGKGGGGSEEVSSGTGNTPYEAYQDLVLKNKKTITLAQTGFYLIGDAAAKNGIALCLDFLSREQTIKMESLVYITKDVPAADFINNAINNKQKVQEDLEAIKQKQKEIITKNDNTLVNLLNEMKQNYSSVLIPYLIADKTSFLIEGYTVFDQLKLKDYLDQDTSSGINFIRNIVRTYPIYIKDIADLSISYSKTKLKSELNENKITIIITIDFETMIREVNTVEDVFSQQAIAHLTEKQNEYIKTIIEKPVNYSISTGLDVLGLARMIENQHVKDWQNLQGDWSNRISDVRYEYVLNSKIVKSFIMGNER